MTVKINSDITVGKGWPLLVIAGPCVIESRDICRQIADALCAACAELNLNYIFKASFDKANRSSLGSFRGPGLEDGLELLADIGREFAVPVLTDVHDCGQVGLAAAAVDILQIPAFLCRQTDLLLAAGNCGKPVNVKKGQFMAPGDMRQAVDKIKSTGNEAVLLTERGSCFGYHNLVVDMRGLVQMAAIGTPVIFDCTHSVQLPGAQQGCASGGERQFALPLARAAAAVGIDGIFIEVHPTPESALCDGANSLPLAEIKGFLRQIKEIHGLVSEA